MFTLCNVKCEHEFYSHFVKCEHGFLFHSFPIIVVFNNGNWNLPIIKLNIKHANTIIQPQPPSGGLGDSIERGSSLSVLSCCSNKVLNFRNSWKSTFSFPSKSRFSIQSFNSSSVLFQSNASFTKAKSFIVMAPFPSLS